MTTTSPTSTGIAALAATAAGAQASGAAQDRNRLNANFDMFLQLLTTQLRNQSPLEPMNADQFTQQIVQYSAVEQQIKSNTLLEKLASQSSSSGSLAAIGFLNTQVTTNGARSSLAAGRATWQVQSNAAGAARVVIRDESGAIVRTLDQTLSRGANTITWDGRDDQGATRPDGRYTIAVSGRTANGDPLQVATDATGTVTGIDFSGPEPILDIGGVRVKLSDIRSVRAPGT